MLKKILNRTVINVDPIVLFTPLNLHQILLVQNVDLICMKWQKEITGKGSSRFQIRLTRRAEIETD